MTNLCIALGDEWIRRYNIWYNIIRPRIRTLLIVKREHQIPQVRFTKLLEIGQNKSVTIFKIVLNLLRWTIFFLLFLIL